MNGPSPDAPDRGEETDARTRSPSMTAARNGRGAVMAIASPSGTGTRRLTSRGYVQRVAAPGVSGAGKSHVSAVAFAAATESAAVAVVYAFIVTFFVYREIPLSQFGNILRKSLRTIAMVMALISTASMFGWLLAYLKIPTKATELLLGISSNKIVLLLLINLLCLVLGCIMDMGPLILILTPIRLSRTSSR